MRPWWMCLTGRRPRRAPRPMCWVWAGYLCPALLAAYQAYLAGVDEIADGPSRRFLRVAVEEKQAQIAELERLAGAMLAAAPERRAEAEAWAASLGAALAAVGGVTLEPPGAAPKPSLPGARALSIAEPPARDPAYHRCRFYWPDIVDPTFAYGEGLRLQLRTAVSHLNEAWAVETGGAILFAFAAELGWEFVYDAARWTYDESRHCRMGMQRLANWGFTRPKCRWVPTFMTARPGSRLSTAWACSISSRPRTSARRTSAPALCGVRRRHQPARHGV